MAQINRRKQKPLQNEQKQPYRVHNSIVSYYLLLMLGFFTLFLSKKNYSTARHDKFYLFLILSGALVIGAGIAYLISCAELNRIGAGSPFFQPLSMTDGAFLCFAIFAVISTFCSAYFPGTLIAEVGRNNGLVLLAAYLLVYLIVSRMYIYKDYVIAVFLISSCVVSLLTVLNFFYIDPLGLLEHYDAKIATDFGSTIGNKNTIASYMAMVLPVAVMTLVQSEKRSMQVIAGITVPISYMGALCANSGSVFLGLAVAVPVMAIFCAQRYERLTRFLLALTLLFAGGKLLWLFSLMTGDNSKGFENLQQFLIYDKLGFVPILLCGLLALALYVFRDKLSSRYPAKVITIVLLSLTGTLITGALGTMLYFSAIDTTTPLGAFEKLLRFNDAWGTHRGFMWIRSMQEYGDFNLYHKLFGTGPDTTYYVLQSHFAELNARFHNSSTDCAHNEYINYLITQGALGLMSYLTILVSVCVRAFRRAKQNPTALIFISAVIAYAVQAVVNIYQPITTPLFILFISMTEALNRQVKQ